MNQEGAIDILSEGTGGTIEVTESDVSDSTPDRLDDIMENARFDDPIELARSRMRRAARYRLARRRNEIRKKRGRGGRVKKLSYAKCLREVQRSVILIFLERERKSGRLDVSSERIAEATGVPIGTVRNVVASINRAAQKQARQAERAAG